VTIETEEKTVLRGKQDRQSTLMWCPGCSREVEMVTPNQAAQIAEVSTRTIYSWIEAGKLHFREVSDSPFLVCRSSLPESRSV
jgi:hypothetical protein